ncbi:hypothetical protein HanIR_Chr14g0724181 [Helianthus annuus]|nr:hypothetical protein HanIR_Chr14g0724181 [Helianthus annuus]
MTLDIPRCLVLASFQDASFALYLFIYHYPLIRFDDSSKSATPCWFSSVYT